MDVVTKTIFRNMKAYFASKFKKYFNYTKRRKRSGYNHSDEIYSHATKFIYKFFGNLPYKNMAIYFVALIDNKGKF